MLVVETNEGVEEVVIGEEKKNDLISCDDYEMQTFIVKHDLYDIQHQIISSKIKLAHLQSLNTNNNIDKAIEDLCDEWKLKSTQKIRLKYAVASLGVATYAIKKKCVFLGDTTVGKTCLRDMLTGKEFDPYSESTIGAAFAEPTVHGVNDKVAITYEIWDTAGQKRYKSLTPMYIRGADVIFILYAVSDPWTKDTAEYWLKYVQNFGRFDKILLIGTKTDLPRQVPKKDAISLALKYKVPLIEVSNKTKENLPVLLKWMSQSLDIKLDKVNDNGLIIDFDDNVNPKKRKCCK